MNPNSEASSYVYVPPNPDPLVETCDESLSKMPAMEISRHVFKGEVHLITSLNQFIEEALKETPEGPLKEALERDMREISEAITRQLEANIARRRQDVVREAKERGLNGCTDATVIGRHSDFSQPKPSVKEMANRLPAPRKENPCDLHSPAEVAWLRACLLKGHDRSVNQDAFIKLFEPNREVDDTDSARLRPAYASPGHTPAPLAIGTYSPKISVNQSRLTRTQSDEPCDVAKNRPAQHGVLDQHLGVDPSLGINNNQTLTARILDYIEHSTSVWHTVDEIANYLSADPNVVHEILESDSIATGIVVGEVANAKGDLLYTTRHRLSQGRSFTSRLIASLRNRAT